MRVGSLFSGIGGLDLGLERAGMEVVWQVENDPYCNRVLAKHWPHVKRYGDVRTLDPADLEPVDLICGGFPCQPVSVAGKRLAQADERWLWPEFARIVRGVRPRYVLVENVPGLLVRGVGDVLGDLAALGYDAEWESIPAGAVGAPHLRFRVFLVAHASDLQGGERRGVAGVGGWEEAPEQVGLGACDVSDPDRDGRKPCARRGSLRDKHRIGAGTVREAQFQSGTRRDPALPEPVRARLEGHERAILAGPGGRRPYPNLAGSNRWHPEPRVGRVVDGVPAEVDRIRALGNAVVPQVAEWVGRRLMAVR